ncbi:MAG: aminoacyl-tRNA hydrolase [Elusimicrobiota bacterium]
MKRLTLIGLGNPGAEYETTRHNLGFMFIDNIVSGFKKSRQCPLLYTVTPDFTAVKPMTFMNRSGQAVRCYMDYFKIDMEDLLVVCDDFSLPLGKMRLRPSGSSGGHNGLQSIADALGSDDFARLRLGIGESPFIDKSEYVLQNFQKSEISVIDEMLMSAKPVIDCLIKKGMDTAMNIFN